MRGPLDVSRHLLALDVPHEIVHLPRRVESAHELPGLLGVPASACVFVDLFETDAGYVVTIAPCDTVVPPLALARVADAVRVRRPEADVVSRVTDFTATLAAPVALPPTLTVVADARVAATDVVFSTTGDSWTALKIHGPDLIRAAGARVAELAEPTTVPPIPRRIRDTGRVPAGLPLR